MCILKKFAQTDGDNYGVAESSIWLVVSREKSYTFRSFRHYMHGLAGSHYHSNSVLYVLNVYLEFSILCFVCLPFRLLLMAKH